MSLFAVHDWRKNTLKNYQFAAFFPTKATITHMGRGSGDASVLLLGRSSRPTAKPWLKENPTPEDERKFQQFLQDANKREPFSLIVEELRSCSKQLGERAKLPLLEKMLFTLVSGQAHETRERLLNALSKEERAALSEAPNARDEHRLFLNLIEERTIRALYTGEDLANVHTDLFVRLDGPMRDLRERQLLDIDSPLLLLPQEHLIFTSSALLQDILRERAFEDARERVRKSRMTLDGLGEHSNVVFFKKQGTLLHLENKERAGYTACGQRSFGYWARRGDWTRAKKKSSWKRCEKCEQNGVHPTAQEEDPNRYPIMKRGGEGRMRTSINKSLQWERPSEIEEVAIAHAEREIIKLLHEDHIRLWKLLSAKMKRKVKRHYVKSFTEKEVQEIAHQLAVDPKGKGARKRATKAINRVRKEIAAKTAST